MEQQIVHEPEIAVEPRRAVDPVARVGLSLLGAGVLGDFVLHAFQFLYGCAIENALWSAVGATRSSVVQCVITEPIRWLPGLIHHIVK